MPYESLQTLFLSMCIALVFFMQIGFLCLEAGAVRSKNSINVAAKNLLDLIVVTLIYGSVGFYIHYGSFTEILAMMPAEKHGYLYLFLMFQTLFAATTATIVSGAVAERCGLKGYLVITVLIATFIYPVAGQWVWSGVFNTEQGWLAAIGFVDFAGSTVVHSLGGSVALAAVLIIGPRQGIYEKGAIPRGQNLVISLMGVLLLWVGWFGFNIGNLLAVNALLPIVLVNTFIAGAAGGFAAIGWSCITSKRADLPLIANGVLAGLVGITAGANAMTPEISALVGFIAGLICCASMGLTHRLQVDDVMGVISVHLSSGIWGTVAVALFGNPDILNTGNDYLTQLGIQVLGIGVIFIWSFGSAFILLSVINYFMPLRVSEEDELLGLNVAEHGAVSELSELTGQLEIQAGSGRFKAVSIDSFSELHGIAYQYNAILNRFLLSQSYMRHTISELEDLRDQLQTQQGVAELASCHKSEFLAKVSHELRTPLNGIIGAAELLQEEVTEEQAEYTQLILESGHSLLAIINDVLDFSHLDTGKACINNQPYDLEALLGQCMAVFMPETLERDLQLTLEEPLDVPKQILGDGHRVRQILMHLLKNAFKFTRQGVISINARYDYMREVVSIEVSDTGKGIAADHLEVVFESFEQEDNSSKRQYGGSGLGLTIAKQLVDLMDGQIEVQSTVGEGSTFLFHIKSPAVKRAE